MNLRINQIGFVENYLKNVLDESVHAKRIRSLADATIGVMTGASLAVSVIGQSLAHAKNLTTKHAIKQVDRLLGNRGIVVWDMFEEWGKEVLGERKEFRVSMDWTDHDADNQSTLALNLVTTHGRATPLLWLTVDKDELKDKRNDWEDLCLSKLAEILPEGVIVTILADRGFGDTKLFEFLTTLGFEYVIRFRGNIHVSAANGETKLAAEWVGKDGRARKLVDAEIAAVHHKVGAVVCVKAKNMKEAWCLAASDASPPTREIVNHYAKRWSIDIDQAWRLSRFCGWGGMGGLGPWRDSAPRRRGRADGFQGRDGVRIGQNQLGALGAAVGVAAG